MSHLSTGRKKEEKNIFQFIVSDVVPAVEWVVIFLSLFFSLHWKWLDLIQRLDLILDERFCDGLREVWFWGCTILKEEAPVVQEKFLYQTAVVHSSNSGGSVLLTVSWFAASLIAEAKSLLTTQLCFFHLGFLLFLRGFINYAKVRKMPDTFSTLPRTRVLFIY